ncbi:branched-chain amino acid ABC transporter substrate-binding protein [Aminobacter sp. NyZ550]|jgi:branched-chain amino acid transport system substrate-binding protein|uniref:Amino acid ABC transporter substrate-binding protein n=2 Tax=Aminobacter TaxID=31988 RepID=A0AAC8YLG1_AMIAI|nr:MULTISPECIES: branched-chain amino acid ABC transporter substrate-binding protein [Aminobacter]AMS40268.1 amino acid ABC transporter substrate-binding protein [Aminobacter aminovorans]MBA8907077.1 branched-chain amino acid transport system substrate-binding protein [Aminobacter ciceronei]MBA9020665.1 branched-chain amino acid transport system substrate-binding protein [Aminobacter ciceronei]MBB3710022.1 branched-chain amino acid transport system substrate-binding protein [Aminobacter aminovo
MKKSLLSAVALTALVAFSGSAWADIIVGVAGPITGPNAAFGAQLQKGAEQAVADINAAGGINGEQIKLVVGDDVSDPKQGISVANKFVADGVKFVVGHFNSGVSIPASEVYAENGILEITPAATNPQFTERGLWNTFRTCGRDDQQGAIAGAYLAEKFKDAKIAVIHDKTPYGQGLADETKKAMNAAGLTEVMYEGVNIGDKDFSALIGKMKEAGVTIIYWGGLHTEAGLIIRQTADQGLKAKLVSGDGIVSNELASIAGDAVAGTLNTFGPDPTLNPTNNALVEKFRAAGFNPEAYTLYSYAAMQVIAEAAKKAGSVDPQEVAKAMKANTFPTVLGDMGFDEKGDPKLPGYIMYEWVKGDDGKYTYKPQK